MSKNLPAKQVIEQVKKQEQKFLSLNDANGTLLDFEKECLFARQQLLKSDFTLTTAANNPSSLQAAILNVAAIGISLNPASAHAYLVPRDGAICLDISYKGLVALAVDAGVLKWAKSELVYENDKFTWNGPSTPPTHEADPFSDRGAFKGGYCLAKMPDGDYMVEVMSAEEIYEIRDTSKAYQKKKGPWVTHPGEMCKKTITKRASKSWPQTGKRQRLDLAVENQHQVEGTAFTIEQHAEYMRCIHEGDALSFYMMFCTVPERVWIALYNSGEKGQKTELKKKAGELEKEGNRIFREIKEQLKEFIDNMNHDACREILDELTDEQRDFIIGTLPQGQATFLQEAA